MNNTLYEGTKAIIEFGACVAAESVVAPVFTGAANVLAESNPKLKVMLKVGAVIATAAVGLGAEEIADCTVDTIKNVCVSVKKVVVKEKKVCKAKVLNKKEAEEVKKQFA